MNGESSREAVIHETFRRDGWTLTNTEGRWEFWAKGRFVIVRPIPLNRFTTPTSQVYSPPNGTADGPFGPVLYEGSNDTCRHYVENHL